MIPIAPPLDPVPNTLEECMTLAGDYALHSWMSQIVAGKAAHCELNVGTARLIMQLEELADDALKDMREILRLVELCGEHRGRPTGAGCAEDLITRAKELREKYK
jgi:hypothetical protein